MIQFIRIGETKIQRVTTFERFLNLYIADLRRNGLYLYLKEGAKLCVIWRKDVGMMTFNQLEEKIYKKEMYFAKARQGKPLPPLKVELREAQTVVRAG